MWMRFMPENEQEELKDNLKEAAELLDCMTVDEEKLQRIASALSEDVKDDSRVKMLLEKIGRVFEPSENKNGFENFFTVLEKENLIPIVEELLTDLGGNPAIIENVEKKIFPILFSKDSKE
jgi:hypothetical protein